MQPIGAIPPYREDWVKGLVGTRCCVPTESNPNKRKWGNIVDVMYRTPYAVYVQLTGGMRFGKDKWYPLSFVRFNDHQDDPLILAMRVARQNRKANETPVQGG